MNFSGTWHISEMEMWDEDYFNMELKAYITIDEKGQGEFQSISYGSPTRRSEHGKHAVFNRLHSKGEKSNHTGECDQTKSRPKTEEKQKGHGKEEKDKIGLLQLKPVGKPSTDHLARHPDKIGTPGDYGGK